MAAPRASGDLVKRLGLGWRPLPDPPQEGLRAVLSAAGEMPLEAGHEQVMAKGFGDLATRSALPSLLELLAGWRPDVIVRESHEFASALAAEIHDVPQVRVALGLVSTEDRLASLVAGGLDAQRRMIGLPGDPDGDRIRSAPSLSLTPPLFEDPFALGSRTTHRFRAELGEGAPIRGRRAGRSKPLVYVTFGSVAARLGFYPDLYRAAVDALAGLEVRVIVTTGDGDPRSLEPQLPNVRVERWLPQEGILRSAAALVCHGGYGSTVGALAHGIPVVALPLFGADQWTNARRLDEVGAGIVLPGEAGAARRMFDGPGTEAIEALPGAVERVLGDEGYRGRAREIAANTALLPSVRAAPALLESIARGAATPV